MTQTLLEFLHVVKKSHLLCAPAVYSLVSQRDRKQSGKNIDVKRCHVSSVPAKRYFFVKATYLFRRLVMVLAQP